MFYCNIPDFERNENCLRTMSEETFSPKPVKSSTNVVLEMDIQIKKKNFFLKRITYSKPPHIRLLDIVNASFFHLFNWRVFIVCQKVIYNGEMRVKNTRVSCRHIKNIQKYCRLSRSVNI